MRMELTSPRTTAFHPDAGVFAECDVSDDLGGSVDIAVCGNGWGNTLISTKHEGNSIDFRRCIRRKLRLDRLAGLRKLSLSEVNGACESETKRVQKTLFFQGRSEKRDFNLFFYGQQDYPEI